MEKLGKISLAPFFDVKFVDVWIGDQLVSMTVALVDVFNMFRYFSGPKVCHHLISFIKTCILLII